MKPKRTMRSFLFSCNEQKWTQWTKRSFLINGNERSERNIHFYEQKWTQGTQRSFKMNENEWRERTVQLQIELLNVSFIFYVHFCSFLSCWPFLNHFWPHKGLFLVIFWGFLGPNLTEMNETFILQNKNKRRERNVHFYWTEMNVENKTFIFNERKRT